MKTKDPFKEQREKQRLKIQNKERVTPTLPVADGLFDSCGDSLEDGVYAQCKSPSSTRVRWKSDSRLSENSLIYRQSQNKLSFG